MARDRTITEHRKDVLVRLEYIKEQIDNNSIKLDRINGRVRKNEQSISFLKGVGSMVTVIFGFIMYYLKGD